MNTSHVLQQIKACIEFHLTVQARKVLLTFTRVHFDMLLNVVLVRARVRAVQAVIRFLSRVRVNVSLEMRNLIGAKVALVADILELVQIRTEHVRARLTVVYNLRDVVRCEGLAVFARVLVFDGGRVVRHNVGHGGHCPT